jgi:uroporphyrinogen decarboxylase
MTSKERVLKALSLNKPDNVPFHPYESPEHAMVQLGYKVHEMYMEEGILVEAMINAAKMYSSDIIYIRQDAYLGDKYNFKYDGDYIYFQNNKTNILECRVLKNTKDLIGIGEDNNKTKEFNIKEWKARTPILTKSEVYSNNRMIKSIQRYVEEFGKEKFIFGFACGQSANSIISAMGTEKAMISTMENPDICREIMEHTYEQLKVQIDVFSELGVDGIYTGDASASCSFFSPETYRNLFFEYQKRGVDYVHSKKLKALLHICGRISGILEMMVDTDADVIESLDAFTSGGDIDLADAKQRVGNKVCLKGNLDAVHIILPGPAEKVYNMSMDSLNKAGMNGGYILSTEQITRDTPKEHVLAMLQARDDFSKIC